MCTVKSPKPSPIEKKDPVYMRNPYLDGLGIGAESRGRNSLRVDPGTPVGRPRATSAVTPNLTSGYATMPPLGGANTGLGLRNLTIGGGVVP